MTAIDVAVRKKKLAEHSRTLRQRIRELAQKKYWESLAPGPELVILYIPLESCLLAAYESDPDLVEGALAQKVVLASPSTLVGFLKAIAYGWQQFTISRNAQRILEQGQELYRRAARVNLPSEYVRCRLVKGPRRVGLRMAANDSTAQRGG
jgi:DNA recombination protein RmuC